MREAGGEAIDWLSLRSTGEKVVRLPRRVRGEGFSERYAEYKAEELERFVRSITESSDLFSQHRVDFKHNLDMDEDSILEILAEIESALPEIPPSVSVLPDIPPSVGEIGLEEKSQRSVALATLYVKGSSLAAMVALFSLGGYAVSGVVFLNPIVSAGVLVSAPFLYLIGKEIQKGR